MTDNKNSFENKLNTVIEKLSNSIKIFDVLRNKIKKDKKFSLALLDRTLTAIMVYVNKKHEFVKVFNTSYYKFHDLEYRCFLTIIDETYNNVNSPSQDIDQYLEMLFSLLYIHYDIHIKMTPFPLSNLEELLKNKNRKYGNAVLEPLNIMSQIDSAQGILIRIDDKLKRIQNRQSDEDEDVYLDIMGYIVLYFIEKIID